MKFFVYLMTLLFVGTAIAQNPTILQGNYISNVFGNSNFVLNPNAQTNVANVTNATRSTTTPLVATSEFTLSLASGANATWTLRAFDGGMKGQNCEARFTYRGFATATTKAEIVQNSLVVASLTLTPTTDPRIASINFPCGDLANLTTFRIAQTTANMTGTNEIGGIYVGLATNMANVAQAENVIQVSRSTTQAFTSGVASTVIFTTETKDTYGEYDTVTGKFTAKRTGDYIINASLLSDSYSWSAGSASDLQVYKNAGVICRNFKIIQATQTIFLDMQVTCTISLTIGDTVEIKWDQNRGTTNSFGGGQYVYMNISRFPSSSELVVTPERQNVWASAEWNNADLFQYFGVAEPTGFLSYTRSGSFTAVYNGSAQAPLSSTQVGFSVPNLPVGKYELRINQGLRAAPGVTSGNSVVCDFRLRETTTNIPVGLAEQITDRDVNLSSIIYGDKHVVGIFNNTSTGTRNFIYEANKLFDNNATNNGQCGLQTTVYLSRPVLFTLIPLDQPSNSALYVQGPVKAAETGAAIPEGYVNEFATRLITSTSNVSQSSPVAGTWYSPWTGTLTLPAGNWTICYRVLIESIQTGATAYHGIWSRILNDTDTTSVLENVFVPTGGGTISNMVNTHSGCQNVAITSSKTFKVQAKWQNWSASPTVTSIAFRGDQSKSELYALRLN